MHGWAAVRALSHVVQDEPELSDTTLFCVQPVIEWLSSAHVMVAEALIGLKYQQLQDSYWLFYRVVSIRSRPNIG